jgi:hypothetical protein
MNSLLPENRGQSPFERNGPLNIELAELLEALCLDELTPAQAERIEQLVAADADCCRQYLLFMQMHALMERAESPSVGGQGKQKGETREEWEGISGQWPVVSGQFVQHQKSEIINHKFPAPRATLPSSLSAWAFSYSVATVLLAIALLGAWSYTITHPDADSLAKKNSRSITPSRGIEKVTPEFTFVGQVSGMVDCQWADPTTETYPGAGMAMGRRYALRSGLMELTYQSGAKVILQGPCDYTVESARAGFLKVGKLVARMGAGGGGRGAGETTNLPSPFGRGGGGEGSQPHSQSALTLTLSGHHEVVGERGRNSEPRIPNPEPLFAVRTPTALVEDLGTEFGVEVLAGGDTASHVFQGQVVVKIEGARDENPKSAIQHPKSLVLSAGQSARVERNAKSGELKLLSGEQAASAGQEKFVRRLREPPTELDLLDIVAGGDGRGNRRELGIDPVSGLQDRDFTAQTRFGSGRYQRVEWSKLIDGVFVPNGLSGEVQVDSSGGKFDGFTKSSGVTFGSLWSRAAEIARPELAEDLSYWIYSMGRGERFMPQGRGLLAMHANAGITFDLAGIRRIHRGVRPVRLKALVGMPDLSRLLSKAVGTADVWVLADGKVKFTRPHLLSKDGPFKIDAELDSGVRFLTLAATDTGAGHGYAVVVFGDPTLRMKLTEPEQIPER